MSDITTLMMAASGGVAGDYQISRSLRFNSADSAYLSRTPASAGNRKTWTWSGWVKRSALGAFNPLFTAGPASPRAYLIFDSSDRIDFRSVDSTNTQVIRLITTPVYRDVSAWYNIVVAQDTSQATESNRVKIYVNGVQVTAFSTSTYPTVDKLDLAFNADVEHNHGRYVNSPGDGYLNSYLADVHFIDGQALTPSSFGETDETTGVWKPIEYAGTYGTNGFHLDFSDNTSTTTLGYDAAGSNDWTLNNFSVTAGAGNDSLVDSPTRYGTDTGLGGQVRGNYATLNPLFVIPSNTTNTFANGNLQFTVTDPEGTGTATAAATMALPTSGKWYWEITPTTVATSNAVRTAIGIMNPTQAKYLFANDAAATDCYAYAASGVKVSGSSQVSYGNSYTDNDVIGVAVDLDNGAIYFSKNGTFQNSGDPTSGASKTGAAYTTLTGASGYLPAVGYWGTYVVNFGQRPWSHAAPSGFKALCTQNLPDPTVVQGNDYFNTVLYTGTGSSLGVTGVGFQPDFVWIKERSGAADHGLYDAVRGVTKQLESNNTDAETTEATGLTAFGTDGFTVGSLAQLNTNTDTYVAWNWKANGAGVSNTDGTITSTVSANTTAGISIVTYTGTGSADTVGHGLGAVPRMIIVKNRDQADAWQVYHAANTANPETDYLVLNTTAATADAADRWNDTLPTSTVFSIGNGVEVNTNTEDYVAYCFAEVEGFSKFGSYTGNGSTDGPFVYTGFRPAFVLIKEYGSTGNWRIEDTSRSTYNPVTAHLEPNSSNAEFGTYPIDILSNGFKIRNIDSDINTNASGYIYGAFAESPFSTSLAR